MLTLWMMVLMTLAVPCTVFGQALGLAEGGKPIDNRYRLLERQTCTGVCIIRIPSKTTGSNVIPADTTDIRSSTRNEGPVNNIILEVQLGDALTEWYLWSDCFPAFIDTVYTTAESRQFYYTGCPVDSVGVLGNPITPPTIAVWVMD